jgi:hypothetical protein
VRFGPRRPTLLSLVDDWCIFLLGQPFGRLPQLPGEIVALTFHVGRAFGDVVDYAITLAGFRARAAAEPRCGAFVDAPDLGWRVRRAVAWLRRWLSLQLCLP